MFLLDTQWTGCWLMSDTLALNTLIIRKNHVLLMSVIGVLETVRTGLSFTKNRMTMKDFIRMSTGYQLFGLVTINTSISKSNLSPLSTLLETDGHTILKCCPSSCKKSYLSH